MPIEYIFLPLIGVFAFVLKAITGTGTGTTIASLSVLVIDPKLAVVLVALVNLYGGIYTLRLDPISISRKFWMPIAGVMIVGSIIGASALKIIESRLFEIILGIGFFISSINLLYQSRAVKTVKNVPEKAHMIDLGVGLFSGFCGGFIASNAPPLVLHFGRFLDKRHLRRFLILIFLSAAIAQTATFVVNGLFTKDVLFYGLAIFPSMFIGVFLGKKAYAHVSESTFKRILAVLLIFVSVKLILF